MKKQMTLLVVAILMVMPGLTFLGMISGATAGGMTTPGGATADAQVSSVGVNLVTDTSSTSTSTNWGSNLSSWFFGLFESAGSSLLHTFLGAINTLVSGIFGSISEVFSNWGYSVSGQAGIFAPILVVAILGLSGLLLFAFFDLFGAEKDEGEVEADV